MGLKVLKRHIMKGAYPLLLLAMVLSVLMIACSGGKDRAYVPPNMVIGDQPTPYPTPYRPKYDLSPRR